MPLRFCLHRPSPFVRRENVSSVCVQCFFKSRPLPSGTVRCVPPVPDRGQTGIGRSSTCRRFALCVRSPQRNRCRLFFVARGRPMCRASATDRRPTVVRPDPFADPSVCRQGIPSVDLPSPCVRHVVALSSTRVGVEPFCLRLAKSSEPGLSFGLVTRLVAASPSRTFFL